MNVKLFAALIGLAVAAPPAAAQTALVDQARRSGQVGERYDGYVGMVVSNVPTALRNQVGAVNIRRRKLYNELAVAKRVAPQEVGLTAGCSVLRGTPVGEYYLLADGVWRRRAPGQPAPQPDYCR